MFEKYRLLQSWERTRRVTVAYYLDWFSRRARRVVDTTSATLHRLFKLEEILFANSVGSLLEQAIVVYTLLGLSLQGLVLRMLQMEITAGMSSLHSTVEKLVAS